MKKWAVLTDKSDGSDRRRFESLREALLKAGVETEVSILVTSEADFLQNFENAKAQYSQIRFTGQTGSWVIPHLVRLPSAMLSLKSCDSLVCDHDEWWPRFYLVEGLNRTLAATASSLDITGSVLIVGATAEARAVVAALSRIGFNKMLVTDPNLDRSSAFVEEMRRAYFGIQFQLVERQAVTQVPGVCSIAVNTLSATEDKASILELAYFNFLKPDGFWLDLVIEPFNSTLQAEAKSVGASIASGPLVIAQTDALWATAAFQTQIDIDSYATSLTSP